MGTTKRGGIPLYLWMLLGFSVGMGGGLYVNLMGLEVIPWVMDIIQAVGQIFLRLLFMLVLPLLFAALAVGVAEMGDLKSLGRVGFKTLVFTVMVSAIAVGIGLGMVNWFRPGDGVDPLLARQLLAQGAEGASAIVSSAPTSIEAGQFFLDMIPSNVVTAASQNQILPVMVFALIFGIGMVMARSPATDALQNALQGLLEVMMK
ncbi:MAG: cation:dicarboxylase symporter family transporter, partial [Phenylobacterium sp.]|nr:cation:dicarboxylase symporter family transporter [Phenylobacterium sp.]